ncbi:TatD family hydrolase [Campylobacter sp. RM16187]|uniref:TatD family hydrolase n=1 Tax=Campylobacter sp. RM16187 TaxID=1660063 RepID=UPI0021B6CA21|nr:TatD family hydrolase [Campylobacter sp. RM16187]QKG28956.1 ssDNA/RNA exonuclease, 3' - 5' specific [Campylobacter sp. RM16187]
MIIDTHCHLDDNRYDEDLDMVMQNAYSGGIGGVLIPGADIKDLPKAARIANAYKNVFFAVGVHPYHIDDFDENELRKFAKNSKCIAVGECGLDYFRLPKDESEKLAEKESQKRVFKAQLDLAVELNLPVILHIRDSNEDCYNILKEYASRLKGAVLHCYNASPLLLDLSKFGKFYFGIGGVLTFKNAKNLVEILPKIPRDKLLIETDGPYLSPEPYRGRRNEPFYTQFVAQRMSEILDLEKEEIIRITTQNAKMLFGNFNTE